MAGSIWSLALQGESDTGSDWTALFEKILGTKGLRFTLTSAFIKSSSAPPLHYRSYIHVDHDGLSRCVVIWGLWSSYMYHHQTTIRPTFITLKT